jgi:hypothetical protein
MGGFEPAKLLHFFRLGDSPHREPFTSGDFCRGCSAKPTKHCQQPNKTVDHRNSVYSANASNYSCDSSIRQGGEPFGSIDAQIVRVCHNLAVRFSISGSTAGRNASPAL